MCFDLLITGLTHNLQFQNFIENCSGFRTIRVPHISRLVPAHLRDVLPNFYYAFSAASVKVYYSQLCKSLFKSAEFYLDFCPPKISVGNAMVCTFLQDLLDSIWNGNKTLIFVQALHPSDSSVVTYLTLNIRNLHLYSFKVSQHGGKAMQGVSPN